MIFSEDRENVVIVLLIIIAALASICAFAFFRLYEQSEAQWQSSDASDSSGMVAQDQAMVPTSTPKTSTPPALPSRAELIARTDPGVVHITTSKNVLGSGFVIDKTGYILTNAHVVQDAPAVVVKFTDGHSSAGTVVGRDESVDLALIKVNASDLHSLKFSDSSLLHRGDTVYMLGYSLGFSQDPSFRSGFLSRTIYYQGLAYLEVSLPIYPGDSGSPLFDSYGRVVGVNTRVVAVDAGSIAAEQSLKLAIPSNTVKRVLPHLMAGESVLTATSTPAQK